MANKSTTAPVQTANTGVSVDDDLKELTTNPLLWKPESCGSFELCGWIHSFVQMPYAVDDNTKKKDKVWYTFEIELAKPSKGEDADEEVKDAQKGEMIRLPLSEELKSLIPHFKSATRAGKFLKISVVTKERIDLRGGRHLWKFKVLTDKDYPAEKRRTRPETVPYTVNNSVQNLFDMLGVDETGQMIPADRQLNGQTEAPQLST